MGWFSTESSLPEEPSLPTRQIRQKCWEARDAYFACLDRVGVVKAGEEGTHACSKDKKQYETNCAKSWVYIYQLPRSFFLGSWHYHSSLDWLLQPKTGNWGSSKREARSCQWTKLKVTQSNPIYRSITLFNVRNPFIFYNAMLTFHCSICNQDKIIFFFYSPFWTWIKLNPSQPMDATLRIFDTTTPPDQNTRCHFPPLPDLFSPFRHPTTLFAKSTWLSDNQVPKIFFPCILEFRVL